MFSLNKNKDHFINFLKLLPRKEADMNLPRFSLHFVRVFLFGWFCFFFLFGGGGALFGFVWFCFVVGGFVHYFFLLIAWTPT